MFTYLRLNITQPSKKEQNPAIYNNLGIGIFGVNVLSEIS